MNRREFIQSAAAAAAAPLIQSVGLINPLLAATPAFTFARLRYESGNWDTDGLMPSNLLGLVAEHTPLRVETREHVVALDCSEVFAFPFLYLSGNEAVQFTRREREHFAEYLHGGGFIFADDCNHDVNGAFARTFEEEVGTLFHGAQRMRKLGDEHPIYHSYFDYKEGPPSTSQETNLWGDGLVHEYMRAVEFEGRVCLLYSNKDYGCEWNFLPADRGAADGSAKFGVNIAVYATTSRRVPL